MSPNLQSRLWLSLSFPQVEYAAPLWSPEISQAQADKLELLQCMLARRTLGVSDSTPQAFVRGELGLRTLQSHRDELVLRFFGRLCRLAPSSLPAECSVRACSRHTPPARNAVGAVRFARCWINTVWAITGDWVNCPNTRWARLAMPTGWRGSRGGGGGGGGEEEGRGRGGEREGGEGGGGGDGGEGGGGGEGGEGGGGEGGGGVNSAVVSRCNTTSACGNRRRRIAHRWTLTVL